MTTRALRSPRSPVVCYQLHVLHLPKDLLKLEALLSRHRLCLLGTTPSPSSVKHLIYCGVVPARDGPRVRTCLALLHLYVLRAVLEGGEGEFTENPAAEQDVDVE